MNRQEHLDWCKQRALEYCTRGDIQGAFASMASDLREHEETKNHAAIEIGMRMLMNGMLSTPAEMKKFIEGFH